MPMAANKNDGPKYGYVPCEGCRAKVKVRIGGNLKSLRNTNVLCKVCEKEIEQRKQLAPK